jgi:hypothetical protein
MKVLRPPLVALPLATLLLLAAMPARLSQQTAEQQQQQPYTPRIPAAMSEWNYTDVSTTSKTVVRAEELRFWDRAALQRAAVALNFEQMRPMLEKLNRGDPVTVVAFGDSITASHGGCFHRDEAHLKEHIKVLGQAYVRGHCLSSYQWHWATTFLSLINATWPHPGERGGSSAAGARPRELLVAAGRRTPPLPRAPWGAR